MRQAVGRQLAGSSHTVDRHVTCTSAVLVLYRHRTVTHLIDSIAPAAVAKIGHAFKRG